MINSPKKDFIPGEIIVKFNGEVAKSSKSFLENQLTTGILFIYKKEYVAEE